MHNTSLELIEDFLSQKRIAIVGVSRNPNDFSVKLFQEFCRRGYDVVPVNPNLSKVEAHICFARVQDVQPPVDTVLLMTSPAVTDAVVRDCAAAGVRRVWMYSAGVKGAVSKSATKFCNDAGIQIVPGQCPFMFLPNAGGVHRLHAVIRKITGRFPKRQTN